jgi:hypothetical protein
MDVYFVAPEQDVTGTGDNYDMWVAAESFQQAADVYGAGIEVEVNDPIRVYRTSETIDGPARMLDWKGRRDLAADTDWSAQPVERVVSSYRYPQAAPQP